jgi:Uma2 family endonuclease
MKGVALVEPKGKVWTYEDYISGVIPSDVYEVVEGKEVKRMPTGGLHGFLETEITFLLRSRLKDYVILTGEVALLLSRTPLTLRAADVVAISKSKLPEIPKGALDVPPDLVVEIVSPSDSVPYILKKMEDYRRWGVGRQVWIFPESGEVVVITGSGIQTYTAEDKVSLVGGVEFSLGELLKEVGYGKSDR